MTNHVRKNGSSAVSKISTNTELTEYIPWRCNGKLHKSTKENVSTNQQ